MKQKVLVLLILSISLLSCNNNSLEKPIRIDTSHWQVSNSNGVIMDSCVENLNDIYTLLYSKGLIPHPFIEDNELRLSWVDSSTWTYVTSFHIAQSDLEKNSIKLRAANIDTY